MEDFSTRTSLLLGNKGIGQLNNSKVIVFGVGGVGGFCVEALARAGVGTIAIVDKDTVSTSNINRQIIATVSTVGRDKVDVMRDRILDINPKAIVETFNCFYLPDDQHGIDISKYDFVVDAVDTVTAKIFIIAQAKKYKVPIISSMGTGNKLNPELLQLTDISKTSVCPLAKVMRKELKDRNISKVRVLFSTEKPLINHNAPIEKDRPVPGSVSFVPSVAGLIIAGDVIKQLSKSGE